MRLLSTLLVFVTCSAAIAADLPAERFREIEQFGYGAVDFSTTRQEFLRRYPTALETLTDPSGLVGYFILEETGKVSAILFDFLDDELMRIKWCYNQDLVARYGGVDALNARAIAKFGADHFDYNGSTVWHFQEIDRQILTRFTEGWWALEVARFSLVVEHQERRSALDAGF